MSFAYPFALALAAALIDVTLGYPAWLSRRIGTPSRWIAAWLGVVRAASPSWSGRGALGLYLAPVAVAAAVLAAILPHGPLGFAVTALLTSTVCGRQKLDARARAVVGAWEDEGAYAALAEAEALGADEAEPNVARAAAAAIAARFADGVVAQSVFILIGGLVGAVLCRALALAGRVCRERRDASAFAAAVAALERWTIAPAARLGALFLALAAGRLSLRAVAAPATRPTAPAEAVMLAALGDARRDDSAYLRRALALYRRAAAAELAALALLAAVAAFAL